MWQNEKKKSIDSANKGIDGIWEGRALSRPFYMAATERGPPNISTPFVAETISERGAERIYTIWGKTNLTDDVEWMCPTNSGHRFFKVTVEMP